MSGKAVMSTSQKLRVFLCHASEDKPVVRKLYHRLRSDSIDPWFDEENLLAGQDWKYAIPKAVRNADIVIACLSANFITQAGHGHKEIKLALDVADEQPEGSIFIIPLKLEPCGIPDRLSHLHPVNLFEEQGYDRLLRALQERISQIRNSSQVAPEPITSASELSETPDENTGGGSAGRHVHQQGKYNINAERMTGMAIGDGAQVIQRSDDEEQ